MRLETLILHNFRGYKGEHRIDFNNLTALVGKNDVGKTTILDALGIFFDHKLCKYDTSDKCIDCNETEDVSIGCIFSDANISLVLDSTASTNLLTEHLLNQDGNLELYKTFTKGKGNGITFAKCLHPSATNVKKIITKKNEELKLIAEKVGVKNLADNRSNVSLRMEIYKSVSDLKLKEQLVKLNAEDGKTICEQIEKKLPHFALFRADRPSNDDEAEVQDPMKSAIQSALQKINDDLESIKKKVQENALAVATNTIKHLNDISPNLAKNLIPQFKTEPKWDNIFKLTLEDERGVPINKRGSGIRRLVLISFFKAEAERLQRENPDKGIIYAIEEPETSQHPSNQRLLIEAFNNLSLTDKCQVILTTHVPALVELIPTDSLRYISHDGVMNLNISNGTEGIYRTIANDLGVYPDSRAKVLVCVEGPNDISFLKNMGSLLLGAGVANIPDMENDPRIIFIPMGGHTLKDWVNQHYLKNLGKPEVHIYDRDISTPPQYQDQVNTVNSRIDGSIAFMTNKREMENYLHPDAINAVFNIKISITDINDVPQDVAKATQYNESKAKKKINTLATKQMTLAMLNQRDPQGEVISWFKSIYAKI